VQDDLTCPKCGHRLFSFCPRCRGARKSARKAVTSAENGRRNAKKPASAAEEPQANALADLDRVPDL
jgi:predicted  nucleic acid-binding Zn-ribbon protein